MSTQTATQTDTGAGAMPPPDLSGDDFSPAEQAYFQSRGADTSGLNPPPSRSDVAPGSPAARTETVAPAAPQMEVEASPESINPEGIIVGPDGKARTADGKFVKYVPHSVFHAKNEKLKEVAAALEAERLRFARADERLSVLSEAMVGKDKAADPDAPIDPQKDIFAAFEQTKRQHAKEIAELRAQLQGTQQQTEAQQNFQRFEAAAREYQAKVPDFGDAFGHLIQSRDAELRFQGITDAATRDAMITKEARAFANQLAKEGKADKAPEVFYELAKARGYAPKAKAVAVDPAKSAAAQELERMNASQAASLTLGSAGGAPSDRLSLERLANMGDAEFEATRAKYSAENGVKAWDRLVAQLSGGGA